MKIETITIQNVLAFKQAVTLDVRQLPPGVYAIRGENGQGKTTLLESTPAAIYRTFPSRAKKEPFDYATGPDGFIEVTFELEGRGLYRARLNLDGVHRAQDAVIGPVMADGTMEPINKQGKLKGFDVAVAELLPPLGLFRASVFGAQDRSGSFAHLDQKGRHELFGQLIDLESLEKMAERSRRAAALYDIEIEKLAVARDVLARRLPPNIEAELSATANDLQVQVLEAVEHRNRIGAEIAALEAQLEDLADSVKRHAAAQARWAESDAEARTITRTWTEASRQKGDNRAYVTEISGIDTALYEATRKATEGIARTEQLLAKADEIRAAVDQIAAAEARHQQLTDEHRARLAKAQKLRVQERAEIDALNQALVAAQHLERAERDAAAIGEAPFKEDCAPCKFMKAAAESRAQIPDLRALAVTVPQKQASLDELRAQIASLDADAKTMAVSLTEIEVDIRSRKPLAQQLPLITEAEAKIAGYREAQRTAEANAARQRAAADSREAERQATLQAQIDRCKADVSRLEQDRAEQNRILAETADANKAAAEKAGAIAHLRPARERAVSSVATLEAQSAELGRRIDAVRRDRADLVAIDERLEGLRDGLVDWQVLAKALGKDGLQVLEIDAAGPTVSAIANELLVSCFGGRFSVEVVTQVAKRTAGKDGSTHRDQFQMLVYAEDAPDAPRDLRDMSGGEQIIIDECIKNAFALYMAQRNRHPMRTCWRDETTGPLSPANTERYMAMLRKLREVGGFHHLFFITHNPEAWAQADGVIVVDNGTIAIERAAA